MIIIGNIKAGSVRIYKFKSHKAFTEAENKIYYDSKKNNAALTKEIQNHKGIRKINSKNLCESNEICLFESDMVRLALKDNGYEKAEFQLLTEIVYMKIYHNDIMWQIIQDGIMIGDHKYIFYTATTGQVRECTITLLKEDFYIKHMGVLLVGLNKKMINDGCGINKNKGMNVGKFISYTALPLSSSVTLEKVIDLERCIVVKGLETTITDMVKFVDIQQDNTGQFYVADTPKECSKQDVDIEHTDGAGMFLPGELPSSCQIRGGYFKGAMFPFDFRSFAATIAKNTVIEDAWEDKVDIVEKDIRYIFTTSQLKMWKMYSSWEEYKKAFKDNGVKITINSYANSPKEKVSFSYQYIQTLPYGCDIRKLGQAAKDDLKRLVEDLEYVKHEMGYVLDIETSLDEESNEGAKSGEDCSTECKETGYLEQGKNGNVLIAAALDVCPELIYDSYIQKKIRKLICSRRKKYKGGKIPIKGYYSYVAPDMYAFCEYLFMGEKKPKGLVPKNHVYNKYYDDKGTVEHIICLRSPHLSRYEYGKRNIVKSEKCKKWFKYMKSDTVVSCHDLLSKTLMCDFDGDEILVSDDENLYELAKDLPDYPLYYEMQQADPQQITNEAIFDTLVKGFDNNVIGDSSNAMTKLWNTPNATKDNPMPYDDAINVFCAYSNYAIDYPKTGKNLALGKYEELYNKLVPKGLFEKSEIPLPYFFKDLKRKKATVAVRHTKSVMDRLNEFISKGTGRLKPKYFDDDKNNSFDYRLLMNNETDKDGKAKYEVNRYDDKYETLYYLLKSRKLSKQNMCKSVNTEIEKNYTDYSDVVGKYEIFHYYFIQETKKIFTEDGTYNVDLCVNYMIDMEYNKPEFATKSKDILWECFGHIMVENLQNNKDKDIVIKFRPRMSYQKGIKRDKLLDMLLNKRLNGKNIDIMSSDLSFIKNSLKTKKNGNYYKNDFELLYTMYCIFKQAFESESLNDGWLIITKRLHTKVFDNRSKKKNKKTIFFNMNRILLISGAKSYKSSLKRFSEMENIEIEQDKKSIKIKFIMPNSDNKVLFSVNDVYNPMIYYRSYKENKEIQQCKVCGRDFIKINKNDKTCCDKCSEVLRKINNACLNEKIKGKGA